MKLRYIICIIFTLLCTVFLFACQAPNNDTDTDTDTETDTDTYSDIIINTDPLGPIISDTEIVLPDDELDDTDTSTDTTTGTTIDTDKDTDSSTGSQPDTDLEPEPEPTPVDVEITLFENGQSEYTIVYPKNNEIIEYHVKELVSHISSNYGVTIPYKAVNRDEEVGDKEIVVGFVRNNVLYAASEMSRINDFILDVCDNDYVIYTAYDAMYAYAFRILEDKILTKATNGTLTIKPDDEFSLRKSEYKDVAFVDYLKTTNTSGKYDASLLCELFVGLSYTATDGTTLPYRLYLPSTYDKSKSYPVIVFLHGAGERGNDNINQMGNMLPEMFNQSNSSLIEEAIVICPQCPSNNQWVDTPWENGNYSIESVPESNELKAVVEILDKVKNDFSTDENRCYAMGISMGGFGTWDLIMRHTELFAAAVPVCGGADISQAENLKYMPIYTAHASNDWAVPYAGTSAMVEALKNVESTSVIFKCHADGSLSSGGHLIWGEIGDDPEMLEWLFKQKRGIKIGDNELPPVTVF